MKPFLTTKKKMLELLVLVFLVAVFYFIWPLEVVMLFALGFVWNWAASQHLEYVDSHRYRYSMLRLITSLQFWVTRPVKNLPGPVKILPRSLPAGFFWCVVIFFTDSNMPWWSTFLGSFVFELTQFETYFSRRKVESIS